MDEGVTITNPEIEDYIRSLYPGVHEVFYEMEERAEGSDVKIVGPLVGRFLSQICLLRGPKSIFEMGSGFGYSALWFSLFLGDGGVVTCTDWLEENAEAARGYFTRPGRSASSALSAETRSTYWRIRTVNLILYSMT